MVFILPSTISNKQSDLLAKNLLWVANIIILSGFICFFKSSKIPFAVSISKLPAGSLDIETAKGIFELLKKQIKPDRIIIFATHNRFFANKSDCLLEIVDGNIKTINGWVSNSKL